MNFILVTCDILSLVYVEQAKIWQQPIGLDFNYYSHSFSFVLVAVKNKVSVMK